MKKQFMGYDQFGNTYHGLEHPRKDLMERLGFRSAHKMYRDGKLPGSGVHIGYVISRFWIEVFRVLPFKKEGES